MASKIWVFGDSFSTQDYPLVNGTETIENWSWLAHVCKELQIPEAEVRANYGVSNDWIFHEFTTNINNMTAGDYVIIQTTQKHRQWFFEDPSISNYWIKDLERYVSKDESKAVEMYVAYLQKDKLDDLRYVQFSLALERLSQLAEHLRILVLPGFFGVNGVKGTLVSIGDAEFDPTTSPQQYYNSHDGKDPRLNHISKVNHEILGKKIVDFFNNGSLIDLTVGFETGFLK